MFATEIRFSRINSSCGDAFLVFKDGLPLMRIAGVESVNLCPQGRIGISEPWASGYNWSVRFKGLVEIHRLASCVLEPLL
jgi:hypothetical protein